MTISFRRVALPEFLLEQGCNDPQAAAPILAKIAVGKISASILEPALALPPNPTHAQVMRHGMHPDYGKVREVSVLLVPRLLAEIQKAARGLNANWMMIDTIVLSIPKNESASENPAIPVKRITAAKAHEARILRALEELGIAPLALPKGEQGKRGVKSTVRAHIGDKTPKNPNGLSNAQFEKAWNAALKSRAIRTN